MKIYNDSIQLVGNTPMFHLKKVEKNLDATILAKLEFWNPSGSIKDRIAVEMLKKAEEEGLIKKGDTVVEPTSGNTGCALSYACAIMGYRFIAVMPEAMSQERQDMIKAFGGELVLIPSQGKAAPGSFTKEDLEETVRKAEELSQKEHHFMCNQFANMNNTLAHKNTTSKEIWDQTGGQLDAFVAAVGTGGTAMGVALGLKEKNPDIKIYVVEPSCSAVLAKETPGFHKIQGIGEGFVPELIQPELYDGIISISDNEAKAYSCRLARLEGIFGGYSSGCNVLASIKIARKLGPGSTVVTVIADSGMKYLSTDLFKYDSKVCDEFCKPANLETSDIRCYALHEVYGGL